MRPEGTIYHSKKRETHGEIILRLPPFLRALYHFLRGVGLGVIALVFLIFTFTFGPLIIKEISYDLRLKDNQFLVDEETVTKVSKAQEIGKVQEEAKNWGVDSYFSIVIPKIGATSKILPNIDPLSKSEYLEALKKGVAHAKGSYFPGQGGRIFLFSHSTDSPLNFARYNAIFYLLRKLEKGDRIIIFFANARYEYEVLEKVIVPVSDTSWLKFDKQSEELVLMTCDPPGTTLRRLLVIAQPVAI